MKTTPVQQEKVTSSSNEGGAPDPSRSRPHPSVSTILSSVHRELQQIASTKVRYSRKARFISISRLICGKIRYTPKKVCLADLLILYDNQLNLEKLAKRDPSFNSKFGKDLESLAKILKETRIDVRSVSRAIKRISSQLKSLDSFNLPERNLSQLQLRLHNWAWLEKSSSEGVEKCRIPPKRYVGMGYTDKGSARKAWEDGSPTWQEMALIPEDQMMEFHKRYIERSKKLERKS